MASEAGGAFEEAFRRLEETVARLEEGGLPLEEALALYEEGMRLAQTCQELLDQAELRITRLQEAFAAYREDATRGLSEDEPVYAPGGEEDEPLVEG
ncbi:MAG: exodeoxyribonuclease VII small subunit [Dehalococcoidia bacterium]